MRNQLATALVAVLLGTLVPPQLAAQRRSGGFMHEMPQPPTRHEPAQAAPVFEAGRPRSDVPYVRDGVWYGHAAPNDARFNLARPFQLGRFASVGPTHVFPVTRFDRGTRRIWLGGGQFTIADWDWAVTAPWCWTCDSFTVYLDPDHAGWYLLYDARMGEYVHAQYVGT